MRLCYAVTESAIETPVSPLNKVLGTLLQSMNIRTTRSKLFLAEHGPVMSPADVKVLIDCLLFEAMQSEDAAKRSSLQPSPLLRVLSSRFGPNAMERIPQGRMGNLFLI